jgi:predicted Na+-dependent transporter
VQAPFKAQKMIQPSTRNAEVWFDTIGIDHSKKLGWIQSKRSKLFGLKGEKTTVRFSRERLIEILSRSSSHRKIFLNMQQPSLSIVIINAVLCFTMMPLRTAGMVLLGSVSGGQGSNLFALLAGGDVALSVVCTLSTIIYKESLPPRSSSDYC